MSEARADHRDPAGPLRNRSARTAAVIVVLLEVVPEVKRRQIRRALEAYEAMRGATQPDGSAGHPGSPEPPA